MSFHHHGDGGPQESDVEKDLIQRFTEQIKGRAKRAYSQGRLNGDDLGDLAAVITTDADKEKIILDFGKPVTWLAMNADDAISLAQELIRRARTISKKPFVLEV